MTEPRQACPFKIGDRVRFTPNSHVYGWAWSSFDRLRVHPGDTGVITEIKNDYLTLDDGRGGFHWECFDRVE